MTAWSRLIACLLLVGGSAVFAAERIEPVGTWRCVLYGHPALGDERVLMQIDPDGGTSIVRLSAETGGRWSPMSQWERRRNRIYFEDGRTGRRFEADLDRESFGGRWETVSSNGGWWCTPFAGDVSALPRSDFFSDTRLMPPLIPRTMATPFYPRQAIREAKEGRAVVCFMVDSSGAINQPEILELSDDVFRYSTLRALERSNYVGWEDSTTSRPGCRSFIYRLDSIY